jgi:hypothetical protein
LCAAPVRRRALALVQETRPGALELNVPDITTTKCRDRAIIAMLLG